jgi:hypothetical protein
MPVKFQFFAQDHLGDHNLEKEFDSVKAANQQFRYIREDEGYWTAGRNGEEVFVPWHRIDFIRITKIED